ncbi:MAG: helix-turn-helix domain containing protein [Actinomycetota bacterium]|nr:helix-turn-helix domain containing protein [Actinomycetota bacterium]MDA8294076.1 helix-turn-helix domain containing protein [Actinomycetota bacterium]
MVRRADKASVPPGRSSRPSGRVEVTEALLDAAEVELLRHGADASVRRIAAAAGVNHGLVHRHFGAKANLVAAVLARLARQAAAQLDGASELDGASQLDLLVADGPVARHLRIVARLLLDGEDVGALQPDHPAIAALVGRALRDGDVAPERARASVAQAVALLFGWQLFEPFLLDATGASLEGARADLPRAVAALALRGPRGDRVTG